jgi:hypothetical protein
MLLDVLTARLGLESCWTRAGFLGLALTCIASSNFAQKLPEATQGPSVASLTPEFAEPASEFAGPDRCVSCHKEVAAEYGKTTHSKLVFPKKEYIHGCESCHGPAKANSDDHSWAATRNLAPKSVDEYIASS